MKKYKKFILKTQDKLIEHKITNVRIFTLIYSKKIKKNEFHSSKVFRLIVETENKIFQYIVINGFVESDSNGNINVLTPLSLKYVILKEPFYTQNEYIEAKNMVKLYKEKMKFGLSLDEVMEHAKFETIIDINKIMKKQISFEKGGGF